MAHDQSLLEFNCAQFFILAKEGEGVGYKVEPSSFVSTVVGVYDKAAASVQDIPQLEKFVMEGVFWSDTPMLQTIAGHEGVTPECRDKVNAALLETLPPMDDYLKLYDAYQPSVVLDVAALVSFICVSLCATFAVLYCSKFRR